MCYVDLKSIPYSTTRTYLQICLKKVNTAPKMKFSIKDFFSKCD